MTAAMKASTKKQKSALIIARYQFKKNGHVVYAVRSSNGKDQYCTTIINGKATGCTCPATKPCYHMRDCQALEAKRTPKQAAAVTLATVNQEAEAVCPVESLAEKKARLYAEVEAQTPGYVSGILAEKEARRARHAAKLAAIHEANAQAEQALAAEEQLTTTEISTQSDTPATVNADHEADLEAYRNRPPHQHNWSFERWNAHLEARAEEKARKRLLSAEHPAVTEAQHIVNESRSASPVVESLVEREARLKACGLWR